MSFSPLSRGRAKIWGVIAQRFGELLAGEAEPVLGDDPTQRRDHGGGPNQRRSHRSRPDVWPLPHHFPMAKVLPKRGDDPHQESQDLCATTSQDSDPQKNPGGNWDGREKTGCFFFGLFFFWPKNWLFVYFLAEEAQVSGELRSSTTCPQIIEAFGSCRRSQTLGGSSQGITDRYKQGHKNFFPG